MHPLAPCLSITMGDITVRLKFQKTLAVANPKISVLGSLDLVAADILEKYSILQAFLPFWSIYYNFIPTVSHTALLGAPCLASESLPLKFLYSA